MLLYLLQFPFPELTTVRGGGIFQAFAFTAGICIIVQWLAFESLMVDSKCLEVSLTVITWGCVLGVSYFSLQCWGLVTEGHGARTQTRAGTWRQNLMEECCLLACSS